VTVDSILDRFENRVEVLGAVFRPGEYALTEGLTVGELVKKAEGLREDAFTSRALVYRKGDDLSTTVQSVDLQGILTGRAQDMPLQREDVLRVYSIFDLEEEFNVNIDGEVQSPGEFPYMRGMTLEDLVAMAGGVKESASRARVEVARRMNTSGADQEAEGERLQTAETFQFRVDKNLTLGEADATFTLMPYDRVFVRRSPGYEEQQMVYVRGEVQYPGTYVLKNKNERISDVVARAGGLTAYAYEPGAQLIRLNPAFYEELVIKQEIVRDSLQALRYQQRLNRLSEREERSSSSDRNNDTEPRRYESSYNYPEDDLLDEEIIVPKYKMNESETQRIGIELQSILSQPKSRYDLRLVDGDTLHVPRELETVKMTGQLLYPISSRYDRRKSFKNYIADAGGFSEDADRRKAYVVYANGSADRTRSFLFFKNYPEVRPGAEIVVPQKANRIRMSPQAWVGIGSGLASLAFTIVLIVNQLDQPRP
jgi:protein involved in polysaccharide export with SLBB domain